MIKGAEERRVRAEKALLALYEFLELKDSRTRLTKDATGILRRLGIVQNSVTASLLIKQLTKRGWIEKYEYKKGRGGYVHILWADAGIEKACAIRDGKVADKEARREAKKPRTPHVIRRVLSRKAFIAIDWDNIAIPLQTLMRTLPIGQVVTHIMCAIKAIAHESGVGRPQCGVFSCVGYAYRSPGFISHLQRLQKQTSDFAYEIVPTGENAADIKLSKITELVIDAKEFDHVFIVGGDGFYIPLVEKLHSRNLEVTVIAFDEKSMHQGYKRLDSRISRFHIQYLDRLILKNLRAA